MIRTPLLALAALSSALLAGAGLAEEPTHPQQSVAADAAAGASEPSLARSARAVPRSPAQTALQGKMSALPAGNDDEEVNERAALVAFYEARGQAPLWVAGNGLNPKATAVIAEIGNAEVWGLEARDFSLPDLAAANDSASEIATDAAASAEVKLSLAVLKYARFARGGRIINPSESLSSELDRRPQLLKPNDVLDGIAAADDTAAYLRSLQPQHPQFEKLRQKYLALRGGAGLKKRETAEAKKLLANMEMWRWMPSDMGDLYVLANVPEFMLRVVKAGEVIHSERIVAGEIGKQTTIFTRRLKHIVLRPMWRVPESIKVRELWPNLRRGGGMFRQYGLELQTKDGHPLDYRSFDWSKADIRDYEVVQPPGPNSVLGVVKFSFPSQHTIYMHDTPDKWMFNKSQRTLSHGCLRVRNPVRLAELLLALDKGWDAEKIAELIRSGPLNNEIAIERKIPVHLAYFTAWVDDGGKLQSWGDVYGHEKRVTQALEGKWTEIAKGPDHLAPVQPIAETGVGAPQTKKSQTAFDDFMGSLVGGF